MPGTPLAPGTQTRGRALAAVASIVVSVLSGPSFAAAEPDYPETLAAIARDIAALGDRFPQLAEFAPARHARSRDLVIDYGFHTHRAQSPDGRQRGGWTMQVPNPDADGVWFYINFHDPDSRAQIDTQPVVARPCLGNKRVTFLILDGEKTKPMAGEIGAILGRYGARPCD